MNSNQDKRSREAQQELQEHNPPKRRRTSIRRSNEDKRLRDSQEVQKPGLSKRRRVSHNDQDQVQQHNQGNETETNGATTTTAITPAAQSQTPNVNNESHQPTRDDSESDSDTSSSHSESGTESGPNSGSEPVSSTGLGENDSNDKNGAEDFYEPNGTIVDVITADDKQKTTVEEGVPDNTDDDDNNGREKQQEPVIVPTVKSAMKTSEPAAAPNAIGSSHTTKAPSTTTTTATTTMNPLHNIVDQSIRRPAIGLFSTREACEAYSVDIHKIVQRHIKWIKENRDEATAIYNQYIQAADEQQQQQQQQQQRGAAAAQENKASSSPSSSSATSPNNATSKTHSTANALGTRRASSQQQKQQQQQRVAAAVQEKRTSSSPSSASATSPSTTTIATHAPTTANALAPRRTPNQQEHQQPPPTATPTQENKASLPSSSSSPSAASPINITAGTRVIAPSVRKALCQQLPPIAAPTQGKKSTLSSASPCVASPTDTTTVIHTNAFGPRRLSQAPSTSSVATTPKTSSPTTFPPSTATMPPSPSSPCTAASPQEQQQKKKQSIDVLDDLLNTINSERRRSTSPPLTERQLTSKPTTLPSDMDVAAAASSTTAPQQSTTQPHVFLGDGVADIYQSLCNLDRKRIRHYPQYYSHNRNLTVSVPNVRGKVKVLQHKENIAMFGKIGTTSLNGTCPQKIDMKKNYTQSNSSSSNDPQEYYRKKLPPPVSRDPVIPSILENNKVDIAITMDTLSKLIEIPNNALLEFDIPIVVRENENGSKTLFMDQPLLHDKIEAHKQNQIAYDLAFKSNRLNWKRRHSLKTHCEPETKNESSKDNREDENIRYDLYTFGDRSILLQRRQDALMEGISNSNKQTYLTTALDYSKDSSQSQRLDLLKFTNTRTKYWLQSYVSGHGKILEGQIHVATNQLVGMRYLDMRTIMANCWEPTQESEFIRTLLSDLYKKLESGKTYVLRKNKDAALSLFESTSAENAHFDLYHAYPSENNAPF